MTEAANVPPSHDEIARRANEIAERRGGARGFEREDWLQAERELRRERGLPVAARQDR